MAKKKAKAAGAAGSAGAAKARRAVLERIGHAIDVLDEAQAILGEQGDAPEFWAGIIFSAQTSLRLVSEIARDAGRRG